jgi:hypothetical protein
MGAELGRSSQDWRSSADGVAETDIVPLRPGPSGETIKTRAAICFVILDVTPGARCRLRLQKNGSIGMLLSQASSCVLEGSHT